MTGWHSDYESQREELYNRTVGSASKYDREDRSYAFDEYYSEKETLLEDSKLAYEEEVQNIIAQWK